jgi:hypothetical protein
MRKDESDTHVVLLAESTGETRVVSCLRAEWESQAPDLERLFARSVPEGGSRGVSPARPAKPKPPDEPF